MKNYYLVPTVTILCLNTDSFVCFSGGPLTKMEDDNSSTWED